jgi:hypothetical protein
MAYPLWWLPVSFLLLLIIQDALLDPQSSASSRHLRVSHMPSITVPAIKPLPAAADAQRLW